MKRERGYVVINEPIGIGKTTLEGASDNPFLHS
jgi:hypothetical protein